MRYAPDEFSRHEYEIKNVFTEGDSLPGSGILSSL